MQDFSHQQYVMSMFVSNGSCAKPKPRDPRQFKFRIPVISHASSGCCFPEEKAY